MTEVDVRPASAGDVDGIWPLVTAFATSYRPGAQSFAAAYPTILADDAMHCVVAVEDDRIVGYLLANRHPTFFADAPVVWIEELMVEAGSRRRGVARSLMDATEGWARSSGAAYVALATRRATEFYAALGYEDSAVFFRKRL